MKKRTQLQNVCLTQGPGFDELHHHNQKLKYQSFQICQLAALPTNTLAAEDCLFGLIILGKLGGVTVATLHDKSIRPHSSSPGKDQKSKHSFYQIFTFIPS